MAVVQILRVTPRMQLRDVPDNRSLQTERQAASSTANQIMAAVLKQLRSADDDRKLLQASINSSQQQQQQQQQKEGESTSYIHDFVQGDLNVEPVLPRECVSLRFRGDPHNYPVEEAIELLQAKYKANPGPRSLRLGILIMEEVEKFFPVRIRATGNNYHLYHFMEFLVMAYAALHQIASALPAAVAEETVVKDSAHTTTALTDTTTTATTTLAQGNPVVTVPWIFSPYMTPTEICGGPPSLNCLAADLTLRASNYSIFQDRSGIIGLTPMEHYPFNFINHKEKAVARRVELVQQQRHYHGATFANQADGVLTVERFGCNMAGINKPWSKYIDTFPAEQWHMDIWKGLGLAMEDPTTRSNKKLVVGYVDRQNTDRHLPEEHHDWLVSFLSTHEQVDFLQLHMENYSALDQVRMATKCDVLIGMHGNGLTHLFWMRPGGYVIEYFWKYNFQMDYATAAQLLNHTYLGLLNGKVVDRDMVARRDVELRRHPTRKEAQHAPVEESMHAFEEQGKPAIRELIETAIRELHIHIR